MYLKRSVGFFLLCLNSAVFPDNVYKPGEYYVAPGVAYYHFSEKRDIQNAAMANVSAGLVVSDQFSLEAFYGQAATEETPVSTENGARFHTYWADGVYHFNPGSEAAVHPYVLAGLGITNQNDDNASSGNTTLLGVNAGAGIEYFVNSSISLFTDVRDIYTLSGGKNDWMLNAGIKFLFGENGNAKSTPAPVTPVKTDGAVGFYELQDSSREEGE